MPSQLPSDDEMLARARPPYDGQKIETYEFTISVRGTSELESLLDLTTDQLELERREHLRAREGERSSDATSHAQRFRIVKSLHDDLKALRDRVWAEKGWPISAP